MIDASAASAALHPRLHLLCHRDFLLRLSVRLFLDQRGRPDIPGDDAGPGHLRAVRLIALREDDLYPGLPPAVNYVFAAIYIACALFVAYYMHTEYYELGTVARRRLEFDRPVHGRADDGAGAGIFAQAPHAAVRAEHRADLLCGLRLRDPRHVLSLGPELEPRHHRHERRDDDRRVLQPAADRAHRGRRVPAGAERAERLRLHRNRCCARPSASRSARRTRCRSRRWSARCASAPSAAAARPTPSPSVRPPSPP